MNFPETLISFIGPHLCVECGQEGSLLCVGCSYDCCPLVPSRCFSCFAITKDSAVCKDCRRTIPISNVWVRTTYADTAKQLVHAFKFQRVREGYKPIAGLMLEAIPHFDQEIVVCHVPTATSRRRQRGYDHSELISKHLAKFRNLKHRTLLRRFGQTRQVGSNRLQRTSQLHSAFAVKNRKLVEGKAVLLIDDITTTGASLAAAARVLRDSGAKKVYAAVFAQKQ